MVQPNAEAAMNRVQSTRPVATLGQLDDVDKTVDTLKMEVSGQILL